MASGRQQAFRFWFPYWNNPTPAPQQLLPPAPRQPPRPSPSIPIRPVEPQNGVPKQQKTSSPSQSSSDFEAKLATKSEARTPSSSPSASSSPALSRKSGQSQSLPQTIQQVPPQSPMSSFQLSKQISIESPSPQTKRPQSPSHDVFSSRPNSNIQSIPLSPQNQSPGEDHFRTQSLPSRETLSHPPSQAEGIDENTKPKAHPQPIDTENQTLQDVEPMDMIQPIGGSSPRYHPSEEKHDNGKPPYLIEQSKPEIAAMLKPTVHASNILLGEEAPAAKPEPTKDSQASKSSQVEKRTKQGIKEEPMVELEVMTEVRRTDRQEANTTELHKELQQHEKPPIVLLQESNAEPNSKPIQLHQQITEPLVEVGSSMMHKNVNGSKKNDQNMIGFMDSRALMAQGQQTSFRKDIKEATSKLVQKLNSRQSQNLGNENAVGFINLAGDNKGASMYTGHETFNMDGFIPTKKDHMPDKDESNRRSEKKATSNEKSDQVAGVNLTTTINSNVQNINNSVLHDSSCRQEDPGVYLTFSGKSYKSVITEEGIETTKTLKSAVSITAGKAFMYDPSTSNSYSPGPSHESFKSNDTNTFQDPNTMSAS